MYLMPAQLRYLKEHGEKVPDLKRFYKLRLEGKLEEDEEYQKFMEKLCQIDINELTRFRSITY